MIITLLSLIQFSNADSPHSTQLLPPPPNRQELGVYRPRHTVYGYLPYWSTNPSDLSFSGLSHLAYFGVELNADGSLSYTSRWHNVASTLVSRAHNEDVKVHLCLISFSDNVNNTVLPSASLRSTAIQNIVSLVEQYGADGVNIDIEGMDAARRQDLNAFIQELSLEVDEIVIATPAIDWSNAYDYATLSSYSDLFIMGYDYHWSGGDPGPVDPLFGGSPWGPYALDWSVDDYLSLGVNPDRIILGLPLYGRSWDTIDDSVPGASAGSSSSIMMTEAIDLATTEGSLFDVITESPYILYSNEQIWFPSVASVESRILWAQDQSLQGVGFWALGYENGTTAFWEMMEETTGETQSEPDDQPTEDTGDTDNTTNSAPIANAGLDQTVVIGSTINLDGRLSIDPDGDIITFAWTLIDPQEQTLTNPHANIATFAPTQTGIWEVELQVSDGEKVGVDSTTITIIDESEPKSGCSTLPNHTPLWLLTLHSLILVRRQHSSPFST